MNRYRLEYETSQSSERRIVRLAVPNINTALIVAEINDPPGGAQLWDGEKRLAQLKRQRSKRGTFWSIS